MILIICPDEPFRNDLRELARRSKTPAARNISCFCTPDDLYSPATEAFHPCVVAVPPRMSEVTTWLETIQQRLRQPKIILFLPEDNPDQALTQLRSDPPPFDLLYRRSYFRPHFLDTVASAANGAHTPPYPAVFPDTTEFDPVSGSLWATVFREEVSSPTDRLDDWALRLLPLAHQLELDALSFQEVIPEDFAPTLETTSLAFALLSECPSSDDDRLRFLEAMRSLRENGNRVLYLFRRGVQLPCDLPCELRPDSIRFIRYSSAVELLMRLTIGF